MPQDDLRSRVGAPPRSKTMLGFSRENAYAQLGVSPLVPSEEISARISTLLAEARRRVRAKASKSANDTDEQEILRLQKIDEEIGDPKRRKAYDEKYPQNLLLTVQPSPAEEVWRRHRRAGLISRWVYESVGEASFVPTPTCARLWAPSGVDRAILDFLAGFQHSGSTSGSDILPLAEPSVRPLSPDELERILKED
jgi:hypothetical protein